MTSPFTTARLKSAAALLASFALLAASAALTATASSSNEAGGQNNSSTSTTSVVDSQEQCTWFLTGIQNSLTLEVASGGTSGKYDGTEMVLQKASPADITAYTSGNLAAGTADANTECTFYNSKTGITIGNSIEAYAVTAENTVAADEAMGYNLSVSNPLKVTYTEGTCWNNGDTDQAENDWTVASSAINMYAAGTNSGDVMSLSYANTQQVNSTSASERCSASYVVELKIPANLEPDRPGDDHTFTGPSLKYSVTLPTE